MIFHKASSMTTMTSPMFRTLLRNKSPTVFITAERKKKNEEEEEKRMKHVRSDSRKPTITQ